MERKGVAFIHSYLIHIHMTHHPSERRRCGKRVFTREEERRGEEMWEECFTREEERRGEDREVRLEG